MLISKNLSAALILAALVFTTGYTTLALAAPYNPSPSMREVTGTQVRKLPGYTPGTVQPPPSSPSADAVRRYEPPRSAATVGPVGPSGVKPVSPRLP